MGSALMITSLHIEKIELCERVGHCSKSELHKILSCSDSPGHHVTSSPRGRTHLLQKDIYPNTILELKFSSPFSTEMYIH